MGTDIQRLPLRERLKSLKPLLDIWQDEVNDGNGGVYSVRRIEKGKEEYYYRILSNGGEGVVLKNLDSPYLQGERKKDIWLKMKKSRTYDVVITGFSQPEQYSEDVSGKQIINKYYAKKWIGAIEFGVYKYGKLEFLGKTSGMDESLREKMSLRPNDYTLRVIEIEGQELTADGKIRHPRFLRLRDDKNPKECTIESLFQADKSRKSKAIRKEAL
jgi:ATP-dependent DNA ligase